MKLGTRREPSLFEFTSTAPAVLTTVQPTPTLVPAAKTAVENFMESFSTTQLGFQRTIGVKDTYIPRTVLECLCKCAAKTHKSDDLNGAFVLTLGVEEPTLEGVAAI